MRNRIIKSVAGTRVCVATIARQSFALAALYLIISPSGQSYNGLRGVRRGALQLLDANPCASFTPALFVCTARFGCWGKAADRCSRVFVYRVGRLWRREIDGPLSDPARRQEATERAPCTTPPRRPNTLKSLRDGRKISCAINPRSYRAVKPRSITVITQ